MSGNFNMSFDPAVKQQFAEILADYGLTVPQAFKLFANQVVKTKTVPLSFDWKSQQTETLTDNLLQDKVVAILQQNQQEQQQGKSKKYANHDSMMADLASE